MDKYQWRNIGIFVGSLLVIFTFLNAIPWATKMEVKELKANLNAWYPVLQNRTTRLEEQYRTIDKKLDHQDKKLDRLIFNTKK